MLNWYVLEQLQHARSQNLAREAERQRHIHLALASRQPRRWQGPRRFGRVLIWVGGRLVTWGSRLQAAGIDSLPPVTLARSIPSPTPAPWPDGSLSNGRAQNGRRFHRNRAGDTERIEDNWRVPWN
jgi:hypothetical protein